MTKIQIQLPDALYREAKRVAKEREMSLAEVMEPQKCFVRGLRMYGSRRGRAECEDPDSGFKEPAIFLARIRALAFRSFPA